MDLLERIPVTAATLINSPEKHHLQENLTRMGLVLSRGKKKKKKARRKGKSLRNKSSCSAEEGNVFSHKRYCCFKR